MFTLLMLKEILIEDGFDVDSNAVRGWRESTICINLLHGVAAVSIFKNDINVFISDGAPSMLIITVPIDDPKSIEKIETAMRSWTPKC